MLGKLMKYEFKATGRMLIPVYGVLFVLAILNRFSFMSGLSDSENIMGGIIKSICLLAYALTIMGIFIGTLIIIIQRFYKNILCDEGYLMNTLPVKTWHNITAKLIVGGVWTFLSGALGLISLLIMTRVSLSDISRVFQGVNSAFGVLYNKYGTEFVLSIVGLIILMFISIFSNIIHIYASMAMGHLAEKRKVLTSLGAYLGTSILSQAILSPIVSNFGNSKGIIFNYGSNMVNNSDFFYSALNEGILISLIIETITIIVFFIITNYILSKKLNLE